jgi:hypothetical protein
MNVYIDGFNFYYCAVKGTNYKWLNLSVLCDNLFPDKEIEKIKYFTAKVKALKHNPYSPQRQRLYWRALRTIPNLEIIEGNFVTRPKLMPQFPLAYIKDNYTRSPQKVQVERTEEKGSDVNLAALLIYDSCTSDNNESIMISNDSDLTLAVELVTRELGKGVIVVNPNRTKMARKYSEHRMQNDLKRVSTKAVLSINEAVLAKSLFPNIMEDSKGSFHKPDKW